MTPFTRRTLSVLFFVSGATSLIYQVVWTRMAFASFGIITPVLSVVLSVFMLGLAVGSWAGGRVAGPLARRTGLSAAVFYGGAELLIGAGAFAVPPLFAASRRALLPAGEVNSTAYLACSALALGVSIFPWCACMGTTFPFMMAHVRERSGDRSPTSFSFLYLANVLGAMTGTLLTAVVLVEALGFHHTLWVAAAGNFTIAAAGIGLGLAGGGRPATAAAVPGARPAEAGRAPAGTGARRATDRSIRAILFTTGFTSMAMEVIWSRGFAAVLKTQVYSFALIVFTYLGATALGSWWYRRDVSAGRARSMANTLFWLAVSALLPVAVNDPALMVQHVNSATIDPTSAAMLLASISPMCAALGYLTPWLIDEYGAGDPRRAGAAYAINVVGCIVGPLFACYLLQPHVSGRYALIWTAVPLAACWVAAARSLPRIRQVVYGLALAGAAVYAVVEARDFEEVLAGGGGDAEVRRDYIASVTSVGTGRDRALLVNGIGMTMLTPITKFISHLPLAFHQGPPRSMLVICFGMGTTFRSALSWGVDTTVVELVPSVPKAFGFYFDDAAARLADPHGHVVIDDGRRYLSRCGRSFDVIAVDPPPPIEAAGSSLLFSREFYALAKQHLNPGGVVQMWYPGPQDVTRQAVVRAMVESFPHVRAYTSVEGWGMHMLGSMEPIPDLTADQLAARMPAAAKADLLEWSRAIDVVEYLDRVTSHELSVPKLLNPNPDVEVTDDHPYNEYYLLRQRHWSAY
jgi:spermidine synthase